MGSAVCTGFEWTGSEPVTLNYPFGIYSVQLLKKVVTWEARTSGILRSTTQKFTVFTAEDEGGMCVSCAALSSSTFLRGVIARAAEKDMHRAAMGTHYLTITQQQARHQRHAQSESKYRLVVSRLLRRIDTHKRLLLELSEGKLPRVHAPCGDPSQELTSSNSSCRPRGSCREAQGDGQQRPGALFLLSCPLSALAGRDLELQVLVHHLRPLQEDHLLGTRQRRPRAVAELPRVIESPGIQSGAKLVHGRRCENEELRPRRRSLRLIVRAVFNSAAHALGGLGALLARRGPARKPMDSYLHHRPLKLLRSV